MCTCIDTCIDWSGSGRSHDGWLVGWFVMIELCVVCFLFVRSFGLLFYGWFSIQRNSGSDLLILRRVCLFCLFWWLVARGSGVGG